MKIFSGKKEFQSNTIYNLLFFIGIFIFLAFRARWIGHILIWDEAMNLCCVQALKANIHNDFLYWIWRHPPTFNLITLALKPLHPYFAERVEISLVMISTLNLGILFLLNKKIYGKAITIASTFMLACMPTSMLFDVWVKRDEPSTTFGLLAILMLYQNAQYTQDCALE